MCLSPVSCVSPAPQQRQETNKSIPRTSSVLLSILLSVCLLPLLLTVLTHHLHLSQKPFKLLEVESRAAVGGAAAGSLSKPEHCVQHLRDMDMEV